MAYKKYARESRKESLFRTLAKNVVRELTQSGYDGPELVGFGGAVLDAIYAALPGPADRARAESARRERTTAFKTEPSTCGSVVMTNSRVQLRPPEPSDCEYLERWGEDPVIRASLIPPVLAHVVKHIADPPRTNRHDFVTCCTTTGKPFGLVSLHSIDRNVNQAELGKMIGDPDYRGKGYAHDFTDMLIHYGFETLELNRIWLRTLGGNMANIKLNESLGFHFEGALRQAALSQGKLCDVVYMSMLRYELDEGEE